MQTRRTRNGVETELDVKDRELFAVLIRLLTPFVNLECIGRYKSLRDRDLWLMLVEQVSVMGSARHIEKLKKGTQYPAFQAAISLPRVLKSPNVRRYIAYTLQGFKATRFPAKSAEKLATLLRTPSAFNQRRFVLLNDLSHEDDPVQLRDEIAKRSRIFKLKSASDFLIGTGLSHDVIALDTRVIGTLRRHLSYNLTAGQVQGSRAVYASVESALREICKSNRISLGFLDRLLFNHAGRPFVDVIAQNPRQFT